jgi:antitoxin ParD1/3/4
MIMSAIERMTITLTAEMAEAVKGAVAEGEYASSSEVVREALRDWGLKRKRQAIELEALRADVQAGMADIDAGRVRDFDAGRIVQKGRGRLSAPESSE